MIGKVDASQGVVDVQFSLFASFVAPIPVPNPVSGIAVLLDLDDKVTGANRVQPSAWNHERFAGPNRNAMNTISDRALNQRRRKLVAVDSAS
jgi:hypothetical protein